MSLRNVAINSDYSWDAGERARLLQSPVVPESRIRAGGTSAIGAVFIVVNAALGAGLLNFPAAFSAAGGVTAGIVLQLLASDARWVDRWLWFVSDARSLSVLGTCYVTFIVIYRCVQPTNEPPSDSATGSASSWIAVFNAVPTICFGYQCHVSSVPVYGSMERQDIRRWAVIVSVAMLIALCVYTGTGVCGYLLFGSGVDQDVLLSFPSDDVPVAVARAFIILCVLTSYPILHYCGRAVLEGLWLRFTAQEAGEEPTRERRRRIFQTLCWFVLTLLLALFIPDIGRVISLIGGLAACFIFIFPGLCLINLKVSEIQEHKSKSWWALLLYGVTLVVLGAFIFGQTTTKAIFVDLMG
ncbi:sodium-coupled neutral amino acid transporter 7 [Anomaloglossus baeobatrachus]|uniref:sodium-coupled neutral amino acid transporter 7 n=1 Tax=Anomaloglossus baeobatrachus TaxID=238106 RepID=UPI003F5009A4